MARASKYIKTKSNYVIRGKHQTVGGNTIFERDFMTISGSDGMSPTEEQYYNSSNFKFVVRSGINRQKKHTNGTWTEDNGLSLTTATTSNDLKIVLNPNYESIANFAYYGSAVNMVKAAIVDIALRFPAELYFTENKTSVSGITGMPDGEWNIISNDYGIDIYTEDTGQAFDNELRYLSRSYPNYRVYSPTAILDECECNISITSYTATCEAVNSNGALLAKVDINMGSGAQQGCQTVTVYVVKTGDDIRYLYNSSCSFKGWSIRPKDNIVEDFFDSLDDFERVLLNRSSNPIYTAVFNTPYETEEGYFKYRRKYTWPSSTGWNPDLTGIGYESYVNDLISVAVFHDEYDTDNIWRSMTHEAIKNLDWTFTKTYGDDTDEMETIDSSKVEPILKIYGRQYDDLKRKIDNISKSLTVTLDKKDNVPDYFIDDVLNLSGWETIAVNPDSANTITPILYEGMTSGYDTVETNNEFLRRLKVCSSYILSNKGTTEGLNTLLGLFGFKKNEDYRINEYVAIAGGNKIKYDDVVAANEMKYNFMPSEDDPLQGLPLIGAETDGDDAYVLPWYDKNKKYENDLYFQMKGGWGGHIENGVTGITVTESGVTKDIKIKAYDETLSDIKIVRTLDELKELPRYVVKTEDICYVYDITGIDEYFPDVEDEYFSHYFYLADDEYVGNIGEGEDADGNTTHGWMSIHNIRVEDTEELLGTFDYQVKEYAPYNYCMWVPVEDVTVVGGDDDMNKLKSIAKDRDICYVLDPQQTNASCYYFDGVSKTWEAFTDSDRDNLLALEIYRVNYMENVKDDTTGNNPHTGHGNYDGGESYITQMMEPFKPILDNENFIDTESATKAETLKFEYTGRTIDNKKCWWFKDQVNASGTTDSEKYTTLVDYDTDAPYAKDTTRPDFNNFISDSDEAKYEEAATDTIVNIKNLSIDFKYPSDSSYRAEFEKFVKEKVLFYLKQMIPATTIFEYSFVTTI